MIDYEDIISKARITLEENRPDEALKILNNQPVEKRSEVLFLKGEIYFKLQRWGEALNQFTLFLEQSPSDKRAESYCLMIQNILGCYHKDLFNP